MLEDVLTAVRKTQPLIHNITNYVTANDCANILLACGASPIMADAYEEAAQISAHCDGLTLNLGTPNPQRILAMCAAGKAAGELHHPVIFDPVGLQASDFRRNAVKQILAEVPVTVIRCNCSEALALANDAAVTAGGVDASLHDRITEQSLPHVLPLLSDLAEKLHCVLSVTGETDVVTDGKCAYCIRNGHPMMRSVTGAGCQLSAITTAFVTAAYLVSDSSNAGFCMDNSAISAVDAAAAAVCAMGLCGEIAAKRLNPFDGNATFRNYMIDAMYHLTPEQFQKGARYTKKTYL